MDAEAEDLTEVKIDSDGDLIAARRAGRALASRHGFDATEATLIATAISELARNILHYARNGHILLGIVWDGQQRCGVVIMATDSGPGIEDIELALQPGFSTSGGLGLGLPGVKHIMDDFDLQSSPQQGTKVRTIKWKRGGT